MVDMLFTQTDGFVEYTPPARLQWQDNEEWEEYKKRLGLGTDPSRYHSHPHYCDREVTDLVGDAGYDSTPGATIYYSLAKPQPGEPKFLAELNTGTHIWVKTEVDLLALQIKLAQLMYNSVGLSALEDMRLLLIRTFRAWHHHDANDVCADCDPQEYRYWQERREQARKKKAAKGA